MPQIRSLAGQVATDRRAGPRRSARIGVTVYSSDTPDPGHCLDLGVGGVCLTTPHRLAAGAAPTLVLTIPGGDALMVRAEVLEVREHGGGWLCRLAFRDLRQRDRERLGAFVGTAAGTGHRST